MLIGVINQHSYLGAPTLYLVFVLGTLTVPLVTIYCDPLMLEKKHSAHGHVAAKTLKTWEKHNSKIT